MAIRAKHGVALKSADFELQGLECKTTEDLYLAHQRVELKISDRLAKGFYIDTRSRNNTNAPNFGTPRGHVPGVFVSIRVVSK